MLRLEQRVSTLEVRFDALITGWKKGRGEKVYVSSSEEPESAESEERDERPKEQAWEIS